MIYWIGDIAVSEGPFLSTDVLCDGNAPLHRILRFIPQNAVGPSGLDGMTCLTPPSPESVQLLLQLGVTQHATGDNTLMKQGERLIATLVCFLALLAVLDAKSA